MSSKIWTSYGHVHRHLKPRAVDNHLVLLIVPSDPLNPRRPDEHFAPEASAARDAGWQVARVDHDQLEQFGEAVGAVARLPADSDAIYRGWMLRSERYADFAEAAAAQGVVMRTSGDQYRKAHELPGWYEALASVTPESRWTIGLDVDAVAAIATSFGSGPVVLRDYVKSAKHYWHEAAFIPEASDAAAVRRVASRFLEIREEAFTGGFVLRRFEEFTTAEVRTWWVSGRCVLKTAHPDSPNEMTATDVDVTAVAPLLEGLNLPFVSVDLAQRVDGVWRVIELGDGQVSDRPASAAAETLIAALAPDST